MGIYDEVEKLEATIAAQAATIRGMQAAIEQYVKYVATDDHSGYFEDRLAAQAATIERFRAFVRELDEVFGLDSWLWNDCGDSRAAITAADMGEAE